MSSYTSKRLWFMLLMSLGASKRLRRIWFWGCTALLAFVIFGAFWIGNRAPTKLAVGQEDPIQVFGFVLWMGFLSSIVGYGYWVVAHVIRFFGKHIKDDYRDDKLFER